MIILLGSTGYVGTEFARRLNELGKAWGTIRSFEIDLSDPCELQKALEERSAEFVINCAGYTGKPNVDACEVHKLACLKGNAVVPAAISKACTLLGIPWGHISSGCIFTGKRNDGGGFTEQDAPNFSFRQNNCSFYSGSKALGEEMLREDLNCYIWRLRIPFDQHANPRNYLFKLMSYDFLLQAENSLSNLTEFAQACIDCWTNRLPCGIYNLTNPGSVWTDEVVSLILESGVCKKEFRFFKTEEEFMARAAKTPRSNCVLDSSKAISAGLKLSPIRETLGHCLKNWNRG